MKLELLEDLYAQEIAALMDGERQTIEITPRIIEAIATDETRQALEQHLEITREQARRLEEILGRRGSAGFNNKSQAMAGLLADTQEILNQGIEDPALLEAALVLAAQKMEALEIACYSSAMEFARQLGFNQDFHLLEKTLHEEEKMANDLTGIAASLAFEAAEDEIVSAKA